VKQTKQHGTVGGSPFPAAPSGQVRNVRLALAREKASLLEACLCERRRQTSRFNMRSWLCVREADLPNDVRPTETLDVLALLMRRQGPG